MGRGAPAAATGQRNSGALPAGPCRSAGHRRAPDAPRQVHGATHPDLGGDRRRVRRPEPLHHGEFHSPGSGWRRAHAGVVDAERAAAQYDGHRHGAACPLRHRGQYLGSAPHRQVHDGAADRAAGADLARVRPRDRQRQGGAQDLSSWRVLRQRRRDAGAERLRTEPQTRAGRLHADRGMISLSATVTVLVVPGLRDHAPGHWQSLLATRLPRVATVPPMGRDNVDLQARLEAIETRAGAIEGEVILVAHSAGCIMAAHWAQRTRRRVLGALLAAPPDFETPMPAGYPGMDELREGGWLPIPRARLPFPSIVAASRNDPLARFDRVAELASAWGSRVADFGQVVNLNPSSGFCPLPGAEDLI